MSTVLLFLQGGLVGVVTSWAYPFPSWEFFAIVLANAVLTNACVSFKNMED